jgi:hypothetical protein
MGQDNSTPIDEDMPTETLKSRTVQGIADYITNGKAGKVVVMVSLNHENFEPVYSHSVNAILGIISNISRLERVSQHQLEYQISDHQTQASMLTSPVLIFRTQKQFSTSAIFAKILTHFTLWRTRYILGSIDQPSHTASSLFFTKSNYCTNCSRRTSTV